MHAPKPPRSSEWGEERTTEGKLPEDVVLLFLYFVFLFVILLFLNTYDLWEPLKMSLPLYATMLAAAVSAAVVADDVAH